MSTPTAPDDGAGLYARARVFDPSARGPSRANLASPSRHRATRPPPTRRSRRRRSHGATALSAMREITADEAATATRRGAPLVKLCRRGAPHVVFAQARADALAWVGQARAREKRDRGRDRVERVLRGTHTENFRRTGRGRAGRRAMLFDRVRRGTRRRAEADVGRGVRERESERRVGARGGARGARGEGGGGGGNAGRGNGELERRRRERGGAGESASGGGIGTAVTVARAVGKFKQRGARSPSLREREGRLADGATDAFGEAIPSEVYAWGWEADVTRESAAASAAGGGFATRTARWRRVDTPRVLEGTDTLDVVEMAIGARHGLARTRAGAVYSWGEGAGGKLGLPSAQDAEMPTRVELDGRAVTLACGVAHSLAVVRDADASSDGDGGDACVWGDPNAAPGLLGRPEARAVTFFPGKISFRDGFAVARGWREGGASVLRTVSHGVRDGDGCVFHVGRGFVLRPRPR